MSRTTVTRPGDPGYRHPPSLRPDPFFVGFTLYPGDSLEVWDGAGTRFARRVPDDGRPLYLGSEDDVRAFLGGKLDPEPDVPAVV